MLIRLMLAGVLMAGLAGRAAAEGTASLNELAAKALANYVGAADREYAWKERGRQSVLDVQIIELSLTSQSWRGTPWKHRLKILIPAQIASPGKAMLIISGGSWRPENEKPLDNKPVKLNGEMMAMVAAVRMAGCPIAVLSDVPFQPMFNGKKEDALIAYTFDRFLDSADATWPALLPMVKSAVRAMDAVQDFLRQNEQLAVESFTVTGASKRGWTTWLTAAIDPRVIAAAPMVIDMLNMGEQSRHQLEVWGKFSDMIHDYTDLGIMQRMDSVRGRALTQIVDPYAYREKLTLPKMIFLGTNDPYWPVDASNLYWDDLPGEKYLTIVPNGGHELGMDFQRVLGSLLAIHRAAAGGEKMPRMQWEFLKRDGRDVLRVSADPQPRRADVWLARSDSKDFRKAKWEQASMKAAEGGYEYEIDNPAGKFTGVFGELVFNTAPPLHLSTNIRIMGE